jgi:hypothetical protein
LHFCVSTFIEFSVMTASNTALGAAGGQHFLKLSNSQVFYFEIYFPEDELISKRLGYVSLQSKQHGRKARGGHGLPKASLGLAMPYLSAPCGRTTPETALPLFQGRPARRVGGMR